MESEGCPIYANIDLETPIGSLLGSVSFDVRPWLEQASEEDVSRLFHVEYAEITNHEIMLWAMQRNPDLKERMRDANRRAGTALTHRPMVDMFATADWVAMNRTGWAFVPEMCRDWGIDLLVVMARQG
jgi:phage pi2 protein 07